MVTRFSTQQAPANSARRPKPLGGVLSVRFRFWLKILRHSDIVPIILGEMTADREDRAGIREYLAKAESVRLEIEAFPTTANTWDMLARCYKSIATLTFARDATFEQRLDRKLWERGR